MVYINAIVFKTQNNVFCALFVLSFITICCSQYPPKLNIKQLRNENKKIIKIGTTVSLQCPVEKSTDDEIYFEWFKNGLPIENFDKRLRITDSGQLRIKNSNSEDTGLFTCKAINGFGSVEFSFTLIVLDEDYDIMSEKDLLNSSVESQISPILKSSEQKVREESSQQIIIKKTGSSVRLKCVISGTPKSSIIWFHNNQQFTESEPRKGRNSLVINDLKPEDSGNYTCLSTNNLGTVSQTFIIKVIDNLMSEPKIQSNDPSDTTVLLEDDVTLYCYVQSEEFPRIQWLKQIDTISGGEEADNFESKADSSHYIKVMGELYKTLDFTQTIQISDTIFSNDLHIYNVNELDAGKYLCLAANQMGSTFKSAFLSVVSTPKQTPNDVFTKQDLFPVPILVAFVSVMLIIVLALIVWMSMCLCQKPEPNTRIIHKPYKSSEKSRSVRSESNRTYNQIDSNKFISVGNSPSTEMRAESPFYSEIVTNERRLSNVYQLYTNPKELNLKHNQSLKVHNYLC